VVVAAGVGVDIEAVDVACAVPVLAAAVVDAVKPVVVIVGTVVVL